MSSSRDLKDFSHKVHLEKLAGLPKGADPSFCEWFGRLPGILAAEDVREVVSRWIEARRNGRPAIFGFGAHVIKVGLSPWIIALMEEGLIDHLAVNGAVAIHDYELAAVGHTSEDVGRAISEGVFGTAEETALFINEAAKKGMSDGIGLGEALSRAMDGSDLPHRNISVLAAASRLDVPVTVHLALGTDTIHGHPSADGRALGQTSLADFNLLAETVSRMEGGIYFNIGSSVILPEIFLKAVSRARAAGMPLRELTTVVLDFIRHYRPLENVSRRPLGDKGRGFYIIGHHEILVPLIGQAALSLWREGK